MIEDSELLRDFIENQSEQAFTQIVRRHIDLVYSVAYRQVGRDEHLAKDITQSVFVALAQKADQLKERAVLGGWLYRSTCYAASDMVRAERRRRNREQEAQEMNTSTDSSTPEFDWEKLRPVLDETISELEEADRDAVLLRYFEDRKFKDIGERLNLSENAARMRVSRALEKLQALAARRGVTSTASALAIGLAGQAGLAAPAGLVGVISKLSLATATGVAGWTLLNIMSVSKLTATVAAIVSAAAIGTALYEFDELRDVRTELLAERAARMDIENQFAVLQGEVDTLTQAVNESEKDASELLDTIGNSKNRALLTKQMPFERPTDADARARFEKGKKLVAAGENEAALEVFLWCYDIGMAGSATFTGVRNSYLLGSIAKLGEVYPEALIALEDRRNSAEEKFISGSEDFRTTMDLASINRTLGKDDETMRIYETLAENDPRKATIGRLLYDDFAKAQRYEEAALARPYRNMFSMFEAYVGTSLSIWNISGSKEEQAERKERRRSHAVASAAKDVEVLAGVDDIEHASELIARVLDFDSSPEAIDILKTHLTRVGRVDLISDFTE